RDFERITGRRSKREGAPVLPDRLAAKLNCPDRARIRIRLVASILAWRRAHAQHPRRCPDASPHGNHEYHDLRRHLRPGLLGRAGAHPRRADPAKSPEHGEASRAENHERRPSPDAPGVLHDSAYLRGQRYQRGGTILKAALLRLFGAARWTCSCTTMTWFRSP